MCLLKQLFTASMQLARPCRGIFKALVEHSAKGLAQEWNKPNATFSKLVSYLLMQRPAPAAVAAQVAGWVWIPAARIRKQRLRTSKAAASDAKRRQTLTQKAIDLQKQLLRSVEDTQDAFDVLGASPTQQLALARDTALLESKRNLDDLTKSVVDLSNEVTQAGGKFDFKPFVDLLNQLGRADAELAEGAFQQGLKDLLPSLEEYDAKIAEVTRGKTELTEVEKLNAQVNLLQLDILDEHVDLLRQRAAALDEATKKQKEQEESFESTFGDAFQAGIKSMGDLGANLGSSFASAFQGMADQLTDFVTTGKASFGDFARSVLKDLSNIFIKFALFQALKAIVPGGSAFGKFLGFADGAAFAQNGIQPFARGGIVNGPTLFPFAKGIGLMGEAGPEAIMPLRRGRDGNLGVMSSGGGTTNVVVNVDASGSSVEGDQQQAKALGNAISAAVQSELVKQKRPGGLLA
jgi:phage-related minor tail protein